MLTEIPEIKYIRYMRSHNLGNIHGENLHIWAVERKISFLETKIIFHKKNYTTIIRTYWATKYENRSESKFWVTSAVCLMDADISSWDLIKNVSGREEEKCNLWVYRKLIFNILTIDYSSCKQHYISYGY